MKEKPPLREVLWGAVKYSSPRHAEKCSILPILSEQGRYFFHRGRESSGGVPCGGDISFMEARWKWRWLPWSASMRPRPHAACQCLVAAPVGGGWDCLRKVACNSIE